MAATALRGRGKVLIFATGEAIRARVLDTLGGIAAKTGADMLAPTSVARTERGAGRTPLHRLAYAVDPAIEMLKGYDTLILIGANEPISFFNYPNKPSTLARPDARILTLASIEDDIPDAVARLADRIGASAKDRPVTQLALPPLPQDGKLTGENACAVIAHLMPEDSIICDESVSNGRFTVPATHAARPHDWLQITGGSIGIGPPLALGAAVAARGRQVINTEADGSAMYTLQGLWSQARAKAKVITVIWANRRYEILTGELFNVGANPGRKAMDMITLDNPTLDWVKLAEAQGVPAMKAETVSEFIKAFRAGLKENGPFLIEALI
jgi:acetolactate synthase-1/2/3 large subunit